MKNNLRKFRTLFFLLGLFLSQSALAEITVYTTYNDYKNNTGEIYEDRYSWSHSMERIKMIFYKDGEKVKIHCSEMWGFKYKDVLFRIDKERDHPMVVIHVGQFVYYENGMAYLKMLENGWTRTFIDIGLFCYVSKDLNSDLAAFAYEEYNYLTKRLKKFKKENPECNELFDCLDGPFHYKDIFPCIKKIEGIVEEEEESEDD